MSPAKQPLRLTAVEETLPAFEALAFDNWDIAPELCPESFRVLLTPDLWSYNEEPLVPVPFAVVCKS